MARRGFLSRGRVVRRPMWPACRLCGRRAMTRLRPMSAAGFVLVRIVESRLPVSLLALADLSLRKEPANLPMRAQVQANNRCRHAASHRSCAQQRALPRLAESCPRVAPTLQSHMRREISCPTT
jgi:hypothetical protein